VIGDLFPHPRARAEEWLAISAHARDAGARHAGDRDVP
jgi:hypothetical protein